MRNDIIDNELIMSKETWRKEGGSKYYICIVITKEKEINETYTLTNTHPRTEIHVKHTRHKDWILDK